MYPDIFGAAKELTYLQKLRERNMLLLDEILGEDVAEKLEMNDKYFASLIRPERVSDQELKMDRDFERTNNILQTHTTRDVAKMTTKEYFGLVTFIKSERHSKT